MTNAERISHYFDQLIATGRLHPGDRLPKYADIVELFHIPYISVQRAFKTMEYEGKIKIVNGVGSFLNGGDNLPVDFYVTTTSFPPAVFQSLVQEISDKHDLHLTITVKSLHDNFLSNTTEHKVIITESDPWMQMDGSLLDYSSFDDYQDMHSQLSYLDANGNMNLQLPFYLFTYQSVINPTLFQHLGLELQSISDFSFWPDLVARCHAHGLLPSALGTASKWIWDYPLKELSLILMLQQRADLSDLFKLPFYNQPLGQKILDIASDCMKSESPEACFFTGQAAMLFSIGSWFSVQHQEIFQVSDDKFRIVPLHQGKHHLLPYQETYLKTFVNASISQNERHRIWSFLKILLSKPYQKRLCKISGALSPRLDMKSKDYAWNTRPDFQHFLPRNDTKLICINCLSPAKLSVLSYVYELYEKNKISAKEIGEVLDGALDKSF